MSTPTATPRTDDAIIASGFQAVPFGFQDFARTLETELAAAKAECERLARQTDLAEKELRIFKVGWKEDHAELARLRADLERFTGHGLLDCHAICDQRDAAVAERDSLRAEVERADVMYQRACEVEHDLRAEVERLKKQIKDDNRSYGCELRDPNGTIWEQAAKDHARAEKAEAELKQMQSSALTWARFAAVKADGEDVAKQRAERAEADTARLDWLWDNADDIYAHDGRVLVWLMSQDIRHAIDAAMKP